MAETRTFDPADSEGIQKLVRDALGETTRPVTPGDDSARPDQVEPADPPSADTLQASQVPDHLHYGGGGAGGGSW